MRSANLGLSAITLTVTMSLSMPSSYGAGASSNYGRTVCHYLKQKAMTAQDSKRRAALMEEYKRCLKEEGEG